MYYFTCFFPHYEVLINNKLFIFKRIVKKGYTIIVFYQVKTNYEKLF